MKQKTWLVGLLFFLGWISPMALAAGIAVSPYNDRYFTYNGSETILVGASGDYLPHVRHTRSDWVSYDNYQSFVNALSSAGLNKTRLWVGLNHSPGKASIGAPWESEQPFAYNSGTGKWDLNAWDAVYFQRLRAVVAYCQQRGVVVEVTLFDPWDGAVNTSPWYPSNNVQNIGFTERKYFTTFDGASGHNVAQNQSAFAKQKELVRKVVTELHPYTNVYWEIANEPDLNASSGVGVETVEWHKQILAEIHATEDGLGSRRPVGIELHKITNLIALTCPPGTVFCIDLGTGNRTVFDVVNGHYVDLADTSRRSAIEVLRYQNLREVHSFNEGRIHPGGISPEGVRAESWEFVLNGGGAYDQLHYQWSSVNGAKVRGYLRQLRLFMTGSSFLRSAKAGTSWCPNLPSYGSSVGGSNIYYSGMSQEGVEYRLYIHHSTLSTQDFKSYVPKLTSQGYQTRVQLELGPTSGEFLLKWINPATGGTITSKTVSWAAGGSLLVEDSPDYDFDIALSIKQTLVLDLP